MYSQCPDCLTRFRVTAEVLRVAQGTVRCGRCGSAFNALLRLSDTPPPPGPSPAGASLRAAAPVAGESPATAHISEFHFTADDLEKVFVDARDWQNKYGPTGAAGTAPEAGEPSELLVDEAEPLEDITLEGERIQIEVPTGFLDFEEAQQEAVATPASPPGSDLDETDRFHALDEREIALRAAREAEEERAAAPTPPTPGAPPPRTTGGTVHFRITDDLRAELSAAAGAPATKPAAPATPTTGPAAAQARIAPEPVVRPVESIAPRRWQPPSRVADDELLPSRRGTDETADEEEPGRHRVAWTLGCLVLALALLAQLTHYYRQDLVRHPQLGPLLSSVYTRLGLDLAPNWDPSAFEIRQWSSGSAAAPDGHLSVQASIRNHADFAQPYPLLRLELEDRFGGTVATRDFEPVEYLKAPAQAGRMLAPGASGEADLQIVDPGEDAVGYRLNVCLRESAAILRCAQGAG